jgi:hypothetical protein
MFCSSLPTTRIWRLISNEIYVGENGFIGPSEISALLALPRFCGAKWNPP